MRALRLEAGAWRQGLDAVRRRLEAQQAWRDVQAIVDLVTDGLRFVLPERITAVPAPDAVVVLDFDGLQIARVGQGGLLERVGLRHGFTSRPEADADLAGADLLGALRALGTDATVGLAIAEEALLTQALALPHAPTRFLDGMVAHAVAHRSPFAEGADRVFHVLRSRSAEAVDLQVGIGDRETIDRAIAILAAAGIAPASVACLAADGDRIAWVAQPSWLGHAPVSPWSGVLRWRKPLRTAGLAALFVALAALSNAVYNVAALAWLGGEAEQALADIRSGASAAASQARIDDARLASVNRAVLLDDLARRLPQGVWVESMKLAAGEVELALAAPSAADVLRLLGEVSRLRDVTLRSAVSRDAGDGIERFRVGAMLVLQPVPAGLGLRR